MQVGYGDENGNDHEDIGELESDTWRIRDPDGTSDIYR